MPFTLSLRHGCRRSVWSSCQQLGGDVQRPWGLTPPLTPRSSVVRSAAAFRTVVRDSEPRVGRCAWRRGRQGGHSPGRSPAPWRCAPGSLTAGSEAWRASRLVPHSTARPGQKDRRGEQHRVQTQKGRLPFPGSAPRGTPVPPAQALPVQKCVAGFVGGGFLFGWFSSQQEKGHMIFSLEREERPPGE